MTIDTLAKQMLRDVADQMRAEAEKMPAGTGTEALAQASVLHAVTLMRRTAAGHCPSAVRLSNKIKCAEPRGYTWRRLTAALGRLTDRLIAPR